MRNTNHTTHEGSELFPGSELEGELAVDVYQTPLEIVIRSPIAGVKEEDVDVQILGDMVSIRGKREQEETTEEKDYFAQECYWGAFSKTVRLPLSEVDVERASAVMKNGVLTVRIPRVEKTKSKKLKIQKE